MNEIQAMIYAAFMGILGAVIGALISLIGVFKTMRITEHNKSVAALRAAFAPALAFIYMTKKHGSTHEIPDVDKFLKDSLLCHAADIEIFRPNVPESERTEYQKAWDDYYETVKAETFVSAFIGEDPFVYLETKIKAILQHAKEQ